MPQYIARSTCCCVQDDDQTIARATCSQNCTAQDVSRAVRVLRTFVQVWCACSLHQALPISSLETCRRAPACFTKGLASQRLFSPGALNFVHSMGPRAPGPTLGNSAQGAKWRKAFHSVLHSVNCRSSSIPLISIGPHDLE